MKIFLLILFPIILATYDQDFVIIEALDNQNISSKLDENFFTIEITREKEFENYANLFFNSNRQIILYDLQENKYLFARETKIDKSIPFQNNPQIMKPITYTLFEYNNLNIAFYSYHRTITLITRRKFPKNNISEPILEIEIKSLYTKEIRKISYNKINIHAKNFLNLLEKIFEYSKIQMNINLYDESDLKLIFLLKFGFTFYEKFHFEYCKKIPNGFRTIHNMTFTPKLKNNIAKHLNSKFKIDISFYEIDNMSELIDKIQEKNEQELLYILSTLLSKIFNLNVSTLSCEMKYFGQQKYFTN